MFIEFHKLFLSLFYGCCKKIMENGLCDSLLSCWDNIPYVMQACCANWLTFFKIVTQ
jgi:hypothetical protein